MTEMMATDISNGEYGKMAKKASPPSRMGRHCLGAFLVGGFICAVGEALRILFFRLGMEEDVVKGLVPVILIIATAVLTAFGVFDSIAGVAGAGTIVPITGFANAVVSPAMEFQSEGRILGTGAQMFRIAGPVIVYGTAASVLYGLAVYWFGI